MNGAARLINEASPTPTILQIRDKAITFMKIILLKLKWKVEKEKDRKKQRKEKRKDLCLHTTYSNRPEIK